MPDSTVPTLPVCDGCGRTIPDDAPGRLCPVCFATALLTEGGTPQRKIPQPAASLDGFRIRTKIGEGGFGSVYAADQMHPVKRRVAIKILKQWDDSDQALARFEAERQALALMDHPNIAQVYHAGETDAAQPFFVMELIEGEAITAHCRNRDLPLRERLDLFQKVCDAIGHAHRRGIIHRDIKPSNILVATKDDKFIPKVIDFGIAKATDDLLTERTLITKNNQLLGTPAYMSPEQAAGSSIGVDTRSDLYSLGILLYELIAGVPPFPHEELHALPYDEALRRIRTEDPPRPSLRTREGMGEVPPASSDLDAIVLKAIEKDPERRYETAEALARDVARYLAGEAVSAQHPSAAYRFGKFVRRHRVLMTAGCMVTLSLLAGTAVSLALYFEARGHAQRAADSELQGKERFSHADFTQATPFLDDGRPSIAIAHLARAVRTDPRNRAASIRLLETLANQNWAVPACSPLATGGMVSSVTYTADGTKLITASRSRLLQVWDPESGECLHSHELEDLPFSLILHPDNRRVAVLIPHTGNIILWNIIDYEVEETIKGPTGRGGLIEFSRDGRYLLASYDNGHSHVWDLEKQELKKCIPQEGDFVRACLSPDGSMIATHNSTEVNLWSLDGERRFPKPLNSGEEPRGLRFMPDGTGLLVWFASHSARLYDTATGELISDSFRHNDAIKDVQFGSDGKRLVTACADGFIRVWNVKNGTRIGAPLPHEGVGEIVFNPDGTKFASGAAISRLGDGAVKIWDARSGALLGPPIYHPRGGGGIAFRPDGLQLAIRSRHHEVTVWDIQPRAARPLRLKHRSPVWRTLFDPDDGAVIALGLDGEAMSWDATTGNLRTESPAISGELASRAHAARNGASLRSGFRQGRFYGQPHWSLPSFDRLVAPDFREGTVQAAAADEEGEFLFTGCADGMIRVWSLLSGEASREPFDHGAPVTAVAVSHDRRQLASGARDGSIRIWSLVSGELEASLEAHDKAVIALSFCPNGKVLASGALDNTARLWVGGSLSDPLQHEGTVPQLSFSPDGTLLATGCRDNAIRVWDVTNGALVSGPLRHIDNASQAGLFPLWSPDSTRLVSTASHDDTARTWDARSGAALAKPMRLPSGSLSAALGPSGDTFLHGGDFDFQTRIWDPASGEPLGPLFKNDERILSCMFSNDGRRYAVGTRRGSLYLRDFPDFTATLTEDALAFTEALGGFRFNRRGILEQVPAHEWQACRDRILQSAEENPLLTWLIWLARDPSLRQPSPFQESPDPRP